MVQIKGKKRTYIIIGSILALLIVVIGIVTIVNGLNSGKQDPYKKVETSNTQNNGTSTDTTTTPTKPDTNDANKYKDKEPESTVDPATVATVDIQPMELTVSYIKGTPGFEFFVKRTAAGTQYAEFSSPELAGTKCTNDKGVFASIIENPSDNEATTLSKTTTVDGTKYGLSLADATCTSDTALLKEFQTSFSEAYSLLKKLS